MSLPIVQSDLLSDDDCRRLFYWGEDVFGTGEFDLVWRPKTLHFFLHEDGGPVCHVGVLRHTVHVGERPVDVAGVGGVVTLPAAQRNGHAARLVRHAVEFFAREWRVEAGLLFCLPRMLGYYEKLGWQRLEDPVLIEQASGPIESPLHVMVIPCNDCAWPQGKVELRSFPW